MASNVKADEGRARHPDAARWRRQHRLLAGMRAALSDFAARRVSSAPSFADGIDAEGLKREFWHDVGTPSADGRYSNLQIETALKYLVEEVVALAHNPQASSGGYDPTTQPYDEPFRHTDPQRSGAAEGNEAEAPAPKPDPAIAELVERLREDAEYLDNYFGFAGDQYRIVRNISSAIAALTASNDRVAELERERDEAREYGKQARLRENAAEDARIHEHDLRVAAEAEVPRLKAGAVMDEMVESAAERICRIHGVGELVWTAQTDERKQLYRDVARVALLEAALSNQAKASK